MVRADGSVEKAYRHFYQHGARAFKEAWPFPTGRACKLVGSFVAFEALLLILLPGERFLGPSTPAGNRPLYTVRKFFLHSLPPLIPALGQCMRHCSTPVCLKTMRKESEGR